MTESKQVASNSAPEKEHFDLHTKGCGYLGRVRWVKPRGGGRRGEPFLACAINAVHGSVTEPAYTYFDLRVVGAECTELVERFKPDVQQDRKVFVSFRVGDIYPHLYYADVKDSETGEPGKEPRVIIKGRLLLLTHVKVDGETVFERPKTTAFQESAESAHQERNGTNG
ncbi:MAG: DUF3577 domain-containing protein [Aromatoleum sp.]|uniref:DUF3577 domain-containing protein n=1 Tax=Aromatoleum sp. TaxID=2307007 RepID=UPI0028947646|nr:DUF3577 domain-containing protein [Aromatoleum sp.]MDT3671804.1 DUF3577 domain-containing protein [Aromatoleum sp.]